MAPDLEGREGQRGHDDVLAGLANAVFEDRHSFADHPISLRKPGQEYAPERYQKKLYNGEGYRFRQRSQNGLGRSIGYDRCRIPHATQRLDMPSAFGG